MSNKNNQIVPNQYQNISSLPDVVHYVNLLSQLVDYSMVREREHTERLAIQSQGTKEMTLITGQLALAEKKLLADQENLRKFIDGAMAAIPELIKREQFQLVDAILERVANNLQGRVGQATDTFNQNNTGEDILLREQKD